MVATVPREHKKLYARTLSTKIEWFLTTETWIEKTLEYDLDGFWQACLAGAHKELGVLVAGDNDYESARHAWGHFVSGLINMDAFEKLVGLLCDFRSWAKVQERDFPDLSFENVHEPLAELAVASDRLLSQVYVGALVETTEAPASPKKTTPRTPPRIFIGSSGEGLERTKAPPRL